MVERTQTPGAVRSRLIFKLVLLAGSIGFIAGLTEIAFRLFVPVTTVAFQFWDPVVGIRRMPNQRGVNIAGNSIRANYNFNAQGWNYPRDFVVERSPHTLRICMTGDSYVEALQVPCEKQMALVMEQTLSAGGKKADVYPFGCSGFGTSQEYQLIRHYMLDYKPDAVIVFFTQNDVYDTSPYLGIIDPAIPGFALGDGGALEPMGAVYWERSSFRRMMAGMALSRYFLIQKRLMDRMAGPKAPGGVVRREVSGTGTDRFRGGGMSESQRAEKSWLLIEKLLAASKAECVGAGVPLCVVFRGSMPEIQAAERGATYSVLPREVDPYCMNERINEMGRDFVGPICERLKVPYLDLTADLVAKVRNTKGTHNFPDDDHYNADAHEAAGQAMARWIKELVDRGVVKPRG